MIGLLVLTVACLFVCGRLVYFAGKEVKDGLRTDFFPAALFGGLSLMFAFALGETSFQEFPTNQPVQVETQFQVGNESYYIVKWGTSFAVVKKDDLAPKDKISIEVGATYIITDSNGAYKVEKP
ncbi:MAG: hypothetical protein Q8Q05_00040 [bacterium]|nr:hypothetical protein [bacterium]